MGGPYQSVKPMNNGGQLLVHYKKINSDKLLYRTKELNDIPVKVTPHRTLNYSRCVIWYKEPVNMDIKKISIRNSNLMVSQKSSEWRGQKMDGWYLHTLTFDNKWPGNPQTNQNWLSHSRHKFYIPNPQRCFHCQMYSHNKNSAEMNKDIQNADRQVMRIKIAKIEIKCANCNDDHPACTGNDPKCKTEKKIL